MRTHPWTLAEISQMLTQGPNLDLVVTRAVLALYEDNQTIREQILGSTLEHNGKGFNSVHSPIAKTQVEYYRTHGFLTRKMIDFWLKPARKNSQSTRIQLYANQLLELANRKMQQKTLL